MDYPQVMHILVDNLWIGWIDLPENQAFLRVDRKYSTFFIEKIWFCLTSDRGMRIIEMMFFQMR